MNKEQQDLAWVCLPKEVREEIRNDYRIVSKNPRLDKYDSVYLTALESILGSHNLTSDTEPEEMLMVERKKVQELYARLNKYQEEATMEVDKDFYKGEQNALVLLFDDKCIQNKQQHKPKMCLIQISEHTRRTPIS